MKKSKFLSGLRNTLKDDEKVLKYFNVIATLAVVVFAMFNFWHNDIKTAFILVAIYAFIVFGFWYWLRIITDRKNKTDSITTARVFAEVTMLPTMYSILILFFIAFLDSWLDLSDTNWFSGVFIILLIVIVTLFTFIIVSRRREHEEYLHVVRVVIDYSEAAYWILFSVVLFMVFKNGDSSVTNDITVSANSEDNERVYKILLLPFMVQTRVIKAVVGHYLLKFRKNKKSPEGEN